VHTLVFLDPGHFHAALTLGDRHPRVRDDLVVHAPKGPELDDFLGLVDAFNQRRERPTAWRVEVHAGEGSLERLVAERPGDVVVLAGRNDRKLATIRRLHDAGFHVLADKPWMTGPDGLDDLRHVLAAGPLAVEMMTGRHEITATLEVRHRIPQGAADDFSIADQAQLLGTVNSVSGLLTILLAGIASISPSLPKSSSKASTRNGWSSAPRQRWQVS